VWDARNQDGLSAPPGAYQARLKIGSAVQTEPFNLLIDPRIAAEGVTAADLKEEYEHNARLRDLETAVSELLSRVRNAMSAAQGDKAAKLRAIYEQIVNTPEGVRYNKPGLEEHVRYLAGMTANVDEKVGRDAIQRYQELKKEYDALRVQADALLGS
jgi:chromosome segregation ATPase